MAKKANVFCPVPGCRTDHPHREDKYTEALIKVTELPHLMCAYVSEGLALLGKSACNDLANANALGFLTRQRQIQELYLRTLYLLLIAEADEQAHIVSGDMPNGIAPLYRKVNKEIFHGQTNWEALTPGLKGDQFTIMETLHDSAHVSFRALIMAKGYFDHQELVMTPERFADYINKQVSKLKYCTTCSKLVSQDWMCLGAFKQCTDRLVTGKNSKGLRRLPGTFECKHMSRLRCPERSAGMHQLPSYGGVSRS